ncbi:hypothetical protein Psesu_1581 [Pseudoxanthomonas suwonensis 11-1]|uniref:Plasmid stabilization protein ParE n=1 Tax=Pseudoxanthomonas suwonensis (strain 11-1) TaxID=743721 RepID=E6WTC7_PSEUU|nr:hypothetical protein [Pseudoxanthomonas suwonensis]ADV27426.1 hypothetical protein Psesu_1581 [Pseudoxanthomonas suwonensis 11-1]
MNLPATPPPSAEPRIDRLQPWLAALASLVLHVLMVVLLMLAKPPPVVSNQEGSSSGGRIRVDFVGRPQPGPPLPDVPAPAPSPSDSAPARELQAHELRDPRRLLLPAQPEPQPEPPREKKPPRPPVESEPSPQASSRPARQASAPSQSPHPWNGRPPGLLEEEVAPFDDGRSGGMANNNGSRDQVGQSEPVMDVGGYQVVYELLGEQKLRDWIEQGMTEVAIPLPGTRHYMVCPAEVALRRGASKCRMLDPASAEMIGIGDAREVITVRYVYHLGELVWRGPGPYR